MNLYYFCCYLFIFHNYNLMPRKLIKAIAIKPVIIKDMPNPRKAGGILEYRNFSFMAAILTIANNQPIPDPKEKANTCPIFE